MRGTCANLGLSWRSSSSALNTEVSPRKVVSAAKPDRAAFPKVLETLVLQWVSTVRESSASQSHSLLPGIKALLVVLVGVFTSISLTQDLGMRLSHREIREQELSSERVACLFYWGLSHWLEAGGTDLHNPQSDSSVCLGSGLFRVGAQVFGQR